MSDPRVSYRIELHGANITAEVLARIVDGITTIALTAMAKTHLRGGSVVVGPIPEDVVPLPVPSTMPLPTAETP